MQDPNWPPTALATLRAALTAPRLTAGLLAGGALGPLLEGLQANAEVRHAMKEPWLNELSLKHAAWISSTASGVASMCDPVHSCLADGIRTPRDTGKHSCNAGLPAQGSH